MVAGWREGRRGSHRLLRRLSFSTSMIIGQKFPANKCVCVCRMCVCACFGILHFQAACLCLRFALSDPLKFSTRRAYLKQQVASALEQEIADILHSTTRKGRPHSKTEYSPPPSPPNEMPPRHSSNRSSRKSAPSSRRTASGRDRSGSDRLHDRPDGPVESSNGRHEGRGRQEEPGAGRKMEGDKSRRSSSKDRYQLGSG
jgi:hypothetical protein